MDIHLFVSIKGFAGLDISRTGSFFLIGLLTEHGADFLDGFVLRLGHFLPGEPSEEGQESGKNDEDVRTNQFLNRKESKTDDEVRHPVDGDGDGSGHGSGSRVEQLRDEEPRDRAGTGGEKHDVDNDQNDAEVGQPGRRILNGQIMPFYRSFHQIAGRKRITLSAKQTVRRMTSTIMPPRPINCNVLRPAFSMMTKETRVISTFMPPMPRVAYCDVSWLRPAERKMSVE